MSARRTPASALFFSASPLPGISLGISLSASGRLQSLHFYHRPATRLSASTPDVFHDIDRQLQTYFRNPQHRFTLNTEAQGTPFQKRVWHALGTTVPPGQAVTYGALAHRLGTCARAIGNACRANPLPIVVPCHRIVAAHGQGGYAGNKEPWHHDIKVWLLEHEQYDRNHRTIPYAIG